MTCSACGHENRAGRKFCTACGAALALACAACGAPYDVGEMFCGECGVSLAAPAARPAGGGAQEGFTAGAPVARAAADAGARKVVTIVFADLVGSTALHERLDAESARRVMERYYEALRAAVDAHGGTVVKLLGDGVMAAFGLKQVAEDDALRAVRAGVAMQDAFRALVREQAVLGAVGLRVAVNTGEVVVSGARDDVIGDPVNVAARLQEQGRDGDVVLGEATRRLVATRVTLAPLGSITLKGRAEAVAAYRLVSLDPPAGATAAPFVGRDAELARLQTVYDATVTTPATRLVVLLGSPGLGKSRLMEELARRHLESATILTAHCDAAGGATFAPLAQALRAFLGLDDGAAGEPVRTAVAAALPGGDESEWTRIAGGIDTLLTGAPASPEETFFVVRRFLAALTTMKPVVLAIDDLHWAEPLLFDLIEHLVQWGGGVPLLVLVGARPELRDLRSSLVTPGGLVADVITLGGLDAGAATRLAANVIGASDLPAAVAAKVLATSEGNPLFVGELVRMLVQEGALTKEGERWTIGAGLAALEMPPTIHALLAARIERLRPDERTVLERASVVGRHFSRSAVAALLGRNGSELDARLEALRRSELIERDTGWLLGEPMLRFHHVLIRDAAYRRLLKGTRAELHGRLADWMEAKVGDTPEHDETIGWHLEQAHQHLRELGPLDAAAVVLGERAARRLAAAGRRALARDDVALAASLLGRAVDRLPPDAAERADLVLDWCEALLSTGDVGPAASVIDELGRLAADSDRLRAWHTCFAGQLTVLTAPQALHATADRVGAAARELASQGDAAGEAKAHFVHAQALARLGKVGACEAALDQALAAARRAGDRRRANAVLAGAPLAALWGPSPVTRASGRCLDVVRVLRITQGAPAVEAVALSCQGVLEALRGRTEAARRMLASSRTMVEELGISHRLYETDVFAGRIDLLEDDAPAAERALRAGYEGLRDLGLGIDAARAAALLGRALLAQDRAAEAETLSHESEQLAGDDLQAAIAWRGVRAEALARRGDHAAAIVLAEAAVAIAASTDALLDHADARLALAAAFRAGGRRAEADAEERRAFELWEAKGATVLAERARHAGDGSVSAAPAPETRPETMPRVQRRVRPNAATAWHARFDVALAARDFDVLAAQFHEDLEEIDHPTGSTYGRDACIASVQRLFRSRDPHYEYEPLATLGEFLLLIRRFTGAGGASSGRYDVGEYENEAIQLVETDEHGLIWRSEVFAPDHLGDAIARLYERYAEKLSEGPSRERAAVSARALAFMLAPGDASDLTQLYAPTYEDVDHRSVGYGTLSFDESKERLVQSFHEVADGIRFHVDDVLALDPNGFVRKTTATGVWRDGGGPFERTVCTFTIFGPDGRVTRHETFEPDREAEALARFDAIVGSDAEAPAEPRAPRFANVATRAWDERLFVFWRARDWPRLTQHLAVGFRYLDRRRMVQLELDRDRCVEFTRQLGDMRSARLESEVLATRGDRLALLRFRVEVADGEIGPSELESLNLLEMNESGEVATWVRFDAEDLDAAYAELDARFAAGEGAAQTRLLAVLRAAAQTYQSHIGDEFADSYDPDVVVCDHGVLGWGMVRGLADFTRMQRSLVDLAPDTRLRIDHLRLADCGHMWGGALCGTRDGGAFELPFLAVREVDGRGVVTRIDLYDPEQMDQARARFAELTSPAPSAEPFANAASATVAPVIAALIGHDWRRFAELLAEDFRISDRRRVVQLELDRDQYIAFTREVADGRTIRATSELLATRGERLALTRPVYEFSDADVGPSEIAFLILTEVDVRGRIVAYVRWDLDDLDAAYAELDARYEAAEGAERARARAASRAVAAAVNARDMDALLAALAPGYVGNDHRRLTWGTMLSDPAVLVRSQQLFVEMAPDFRVRSHHVRLADRGTFVEVVEMGTRDGGAFETRYFWVLEVAESGRIPRFDLYDLDQIDEARARFAELAAPAPSAEPFANAATRALERGTAALGARDWQGFAALFAAEFRVYDRTSFGQFEANAAEWLAGFRQMVEMTSGTPTPQVVATRGDRLALGRVLWRGAAGDVGPSEVEWLLIIEVDDRGDHLAVVSFNPNDIDAAYAELDARWQAGEATVHPRVAAYQAAFDRGVAHRDWDALAALHDSTLVARDHRLVGWDVLRGPVAYVGALRAMVDLAPDALGRVDHIRTSERGLLAEVVWIGTRDGGAFESPFLWVVELDAEGLAQRLDFYDPHHLDAARARFEEIQSIAPLAASAARDPLAAIAKPNAPAATMERWQAAFAAGLAGDDWNAIRGLCAPGMVFEDRQRFALVFGDAELMIASARERARTGARPEAQLVGTAGDRVVIVRMLWSGGPLGGRFEIEYFSVIEVDEAGRLTAVIFFDLDDPRAAQRKAWARWAAIDPAAAPWVALLGAAVDSFEAHDRERVRALFADDVIVEDHRRTGFGRIDGAEAYIESLVVLWDLAPDHRMELGWFWPAFEHHGVVTPLRRFGTLADGGAFESEHLWLSTATRGRITHLELFEPEDLDKALARLAELRPDPLRIPPNAATRWVDRWSACTAARDWEELERLYAPTAMFDDRRRLMRMTGDRAMAIANARVIMQSGRVRLERTLLATAGDRLALERWSWGGGKAGADFAVDSLAVTEVDANGLFVACISFDPDDRAAASAELFERWVRSGAEGLPPETIELARAFNAHDLERMRALLPAEFYLDDRRRTGVGRIEGVDAYLASLAALWELSGDLRSDALYTVASADHGRLMVARWFGTNAEGGDFEAVFVTLGLLRDGRPVGIEIFELDDLEAATARFEELCAARSS